MALTFNSKQIDKVVSIDDVGKLSNPEILLLKDELMTAINNMEDSIKRFTGVYGVGFSKFDMRDIVRHPIVAELLDRYQDDKLDLSGIDAEVTLSEWLAQPQYELPKYTHYFRNMQNKA